ncbi:hypothetical protein HW932_11345 [Allochromatium humboldtianum]|uniref:Uncharacterized protein n=1 Tax=Allochromatium humboldtianum TaxID=504901 RepID=A0A850RAS8_9GAMM|nr:hypothetical protein [Allochromatium humboldtianum]NVZ09855.1 hypothetical protein [Allochromatium humboldtianum]
MKSVIVRNKDALKAALQGDAAEIVVDDARLIKQLRAIRRLRKAGPIAIGVVIAAIPLIPVTGGASLPVGMVGVMGASAFPVSASVIGLSIAIGGIIVIGILTDWEEVEVAGVFKLRRKSK